MKRIRLGILIAIIIILSMVGCGKKQQTETPGNHGKQPVQEQQISVEEDIQWSATHA